MNKSLVNDYLIEFSRRELPEMVPRELKIPLDGRFAVSVVGPRRSGKTFYFFQLIRQLGKEDSIYLNFEDTRLLDVSFTEIRDIIRQFMELFGRSPKYLFFDEIQNVRNWEIAIRELHDTRKYRIFLTGSSSKLLAKEISTQMRGRSLTYTFLPFSFPEFLKYKKFPAEKLSSDDESLLKRHLREYLEFGGFPDVVSSTSKEKILREYSDAILFKDIVERHDVKNLHLVNLIFKQMVSSFSKEFSVNMLYNNFKSQGAKVSKDTLYKYLNYFEDSVSVFFLRRHSEKTRLREAWPRKVYLSDTGLSKVLKSSEDLGKLVENSVFLHMLRMKNERPLLDINYYKDQSGREVDFVIREGSSITQAIQVTYSSGPDEIKENEISNLARIARELRCKDILFVTWDYEGKKTVKGKIVNFIPLWKLLLKYRIP